MPRALIAGCGYVGRATARLLQEAGWEVTGVTHSEESAAQLSAGTFRAVACDISDSGMVRARLGEFEPFEAVVDCVSSGGGGVAEYRKCYFDGAQNLLEFTRPGKFLFTSSTSVYAQNDGSLITEESPAEPLLETGRVLLETEEFVLAAGGIVARLAGIYGPGRWVYLKKILDGSAVIEGEGSRWINQIHRDDAAGAICHLLQLAAPSGIYNVADNTPLTLIECYRILSGHFHKPLPPGGPVEEQRKRGIASKRVSNTKLRETGWKPQFPSIREALNAFGG
jgi:nucleoside-diphosphate-sugar epimerase